LILNQVPERREREKEERDETREERRETREELLDQDVRGGATDKGGGWCGESLFELVIESHDLRDFRANNNAHSYCNDY